MCDKKKKLEAKKEIKKVLFKKYVKVLKAKEEDKIKDLEKKLKESKNKKEKDDLKKQLDISKSIYSSVNEDIGDKLVEMEFLQYFPVMRYIKNGSDAGAVLEYILHELKIGKSDLVNKVKVNIKTTALAKHYANATPETIQWDVYNILNNRIKSPYRGNHKELWRIILSAFKEAVNTCESTELNLKIYNSIPDPDMYFSVVCLKLAEEQYKKITNDWK